MAAKDTFDFNCPQYVDFLAGLDNSDDFFDCCDNSSPLDERAKKNLPVPDKIMTDEVENRLIDRMTAALSVLENTPKLKTGVPRGKLFSAKAPGKIANVAAVKPILKPSTLHKQSVRMRSKSVCELNKVHTDKPGRVKEIRHKRSSSLNDLRTIKKHTFPKTPLCLKRTMKAKTKVLKTTEELELEQIAELQKQLAQLLRNNEISYKKLKLRQKPCLQKNPPESKPEKNKVNAGISAGKNTRRNFHVLSHTAMKRETMKLNCIINEEESSNKAPKNLHKDVLEKMWNCSVSVSMSEECDKNKSQVSKKPVKFAFHSGLVFHETKKNTTVKPFSFDSKTKEGKIQNAGTSQKAEVSLTKSVSKHVSNGKENIPDAKSKSVVKRITCVQNISDIKLFGSNKKIVRKRLGNAIKGLPLAENSSRTNI